MKKFNLFKMLAVLIVLIASVLQMKASEYGTITVYFRNVKGWSKVYVTFLTSAYWDKDNGTGASGYAMYEMPYDEALGLHKYTYTGYYSQYINFCRSYLPGADKFYETDAVYRADFSTAHPVYVPYTDCSETKNKTGYYNNGDWTYVALSGSTVYFDKRDVTDWTNTHLRIGRDGTTMGKWSSAWPITHVGGTKYLESCATQNFGNYQAFAIANSPGWTGGDNSFYQPSNATPTGGFAITKETNYQRYNITGDCYIRPTSTNGSESKGCQYYNVNYAADGSNTLTACPAYTVTTSLTHCSVSMKKYKADNGSLYDDLSSGGTVLPTQFIEVTVTPDDGYHFGSVSVSNSGTETAAADGTPGVYYILDDATVTATCIENEYDNTVTTGGNGSTTPSGTVSIKQVSGTSISASANTNYVFDHWTATGGGISPTSSTTNPQSFTATSTDGTITAHFVDRYGFYGTGGVLDDWNVWMGLPNTETNTFSKSYTLTKDVTYTFKIVDRDGSGTWWGNQGGTNTNLVINRSASGVAKQLYSATSKNENITITPDVSGDYTFSYNSNSHQLTITYPTSYKVTYDDNGKTSGDVPDVGTYYLPNATVTVLGNTESLVKSGYTFLGWNTQADGLGTDYAAGETFEIADNTPLYAKWQDETLIGKYTFHYGTSTGGGVNDFAGTWTVVAFPDDEPSRTTGTIEDFTNYYDLTGFTIPDPSTAPHYFIGYEGWPKTQLGEHSATPSKVRAWSSQYNETYHYGYMNVKPGSIVISDGNTKTAVGAVGTLTIENSNRTGGENLNIGFSPNGYVLTIRNSSEVQTRTLSFTKVAGTDEIWETEILNDGLTAAEVAGTFKVGLATASGATDCFQSEWAAASVLNANKDEFVGVADDNVDNYPDLAAGVKGRFQLVRVYKGGNTLRNKQNFALRYVTMKNWTIDPVLAWSQPGKWSLGHQPTIDEDVVIYHNTTVSNNNAVAKRVRLHKDGGYHTLTISPYGGLLVAKDIKAYHESAEVKDDEDYSATTSSDLLIETNSYGNGSLICGSESTNSEASYSFFSKSYKYNTWFVNQFVGIPFATGDAWDYYGMNIYEYDADNDTWKAPGSYTLKSFTTYNLINKNNGGASNISLNGVLNLPGNSGNKVLTCGWRGTNGSIDEEEGHEDYMFANSWTAPISIEAMSASDFSGTEGSDMVHTIYIFNAGYVDPANSQREIGKFAGTWSSFPLSSAKYIENAVIPATQAFLVTSKKGSAGATLTLNYGKHVYTPAQTNGSINTFPTRAPRRIIKGEDPTVLRIIVRSDSAIADNMYLLERDDFKPEFDNGWDGTKILGEAFAPQLYAIHGDNKYAVDATPELDGTEIGFKAGTNNYEYTFSFEYDDDEPLYLYDKETQDFTRISNEATYTFQTKDNAEHSRFALTRSNAPQIVTAFENAEYEAEIRAEKFIENSMLFIRRGDKVYSIDGTQVK